MAGRAIAEEEYTAYTVSRSPSRSNARSTSQLHSTRGWPGERITNKKAYGKDKTKRNLLVLGSLGALIFAAHNYLPRPSGQSSKKEGSKDTKKSKGAAKTTEQKRTREQSQERYEERRVRRESYSACPAKGQTYTEETDYEADSDGGSIYQVRRRYSIEGPPTPHPRRRSVSRTREIYYEDDQDYYGGARRRQADDR